MNTNRIAWGMLAWFLGIIVPVMHHVLLHWPLASQHTSNVVTRSQLLFESLPWIDWVYLAAMASVGLMLVVSGISSKKTEG
jgi:hypothetical protein